MDILTDLKPAAFHILLALAERDSHGYGVMQAVQRDSGGRVPLRTGSFYRHLSQLIGGGCVVEAPGPKSGDDPRRGTYYRLTPRGRQLLASEKARLAGLVARLDKVRLNTRKGSV